VKAILGDFNSSQVIFWFLIPVTELREGLVAALHHGIVEMWIIDGFINGPETKNFFEVIEIHPKNTIIAPAIKINLFSDFISPERG